MRYLNEIPNDQRQSNLNAIFLKIENVVYAKFQYNIDFIDEMKEVDSVHFLGGTNDLKKVNNIFEEQIKSHLPGLPTDLRKYVRQNTQRVSKMLNKGVAR